MFVEGGIRGADEGEVLGATEELDDEVVPFGYCRCHDERRC